MMTLRGITLVLVLLAASAVRGGEPARVTTLAHDRIDATALGMVDSPRGGHGLRLAAVMIEGAGWSRDEVLDAVIDMAGLLGQCAIRLVQLELIVVRTPPEYIDLDTPFSRRFARDLAPPRPTLYFVRDTRHQPAFDAEAVGRGNSRRRPEMRDSVWVTRAAPDLAVVLAHELVHVLANSGEHTHLPDNLMRDESDPRHTRLTATQCAAVTDNGLRHGLLTPLLPG